jgi:hypothetical protein
LARTVTVAQALVTGATELAIVWIPRINWTLCLANINIRFESEFRTCPRDTDQTFTAIVARVTVAFTFLARSTGTAITEFSQNFRTLAGACRSTYIDVFKPTVEFTNIRHADKLFGTLRV